MMYLLCTFILTRPCILFIFFRGEYGIQQYSEVKTVGDKRLKLRVRAVGLGLDQTERDVSRLKWVFSGFLLGRVETEFIFIFLLCELDYFIPPPPPRYFFSSVLCWFVKTLCTTIHRGLISSCLSTDYNQATTKELLNLGDGGIRVNPVYFTRFCTHQLVQFIIIRLIFGNPSRQSQIQNSTPCILDSRSLISDFQVQHSKIWITVNGASIRSYH